MFETIFSIWQNCEPTLAIFCYMANCDCCKKPKIKNNLDIWSPWWSNPQPLNSFDQKATTCYRHHHHAAEPDGPQLVHFRHLKWNAVNHSCNQSLWTKVELIKVNKSARMPCSELLLRLHLRHNGSWMQGLFVYLWFVLPWFEGGQVQVMCFYLYEQLLSKLQLRHYPTVYALMVLYTLE